MLIDSIQYLLNVDLDITSAMEETMERDSLLINIKLKSVSEIKKQRQMHKDMLDELKIELIDSHQH